MTGSGDLLADRRFGWAKALAAEGDHAAAADLLDQVVERVPRWAPGWAALGEARERAGDAERARAAWRQAEALDRAGLLGAELHLARLDGRSPDRMGDAYVAALFDDYAPRFERHLTEALGYRGPAAVLEALDRAVPGLRFPRVLDLGCGTGLMGLALGGRAGRIDGLDLSPAMVAAARASGAYADLRVASIADGLAAAAAGSYDLVTAADVLVYVGALDGVFADAARVLSRGGVLAFTLQGLAGETPGSRGFALGPDMRFAHAPSSVRTGLAASGFVDVRIEAASTRTERGAPVAGVVVTARR